jgi:hypothetical protein
MKKVRTGYQRSVTFRSILIATLLIPLNIYWIIQLEVVRYTHPTLIHPLSNVIFILFFLVGFSLLLGKISSKLSLERGELLTVYIILCIVSSLCSHDMMEILVTILGYPYRFASPENEWADLFLKQLPRWLTVSDERALSAYYEGNSSLYIKRHMMAWLGPAAWWTSFIVVLLFTMLCINTFLRKQWTERERLTYPIIQLPLEMTNPQSGLFRNRLMWFGFSIAALISIVNLLNSVFPSVPYIPVKRRSIGYLFTERPWNAMGDVRISFYPFAIGIAFMIPLDLLLSCWVFYWIYKMELVVGSVMGWRSISRFPFANEQAFGAYIGILLFVIWTGRSHFKSVMRHILGLSREDDSEEPMPYRMAALGFIGGFAYLALFSYRMGMTIWVILIFFAIYYLLGTVIARMRAELGFLVHDLHHIDPHSMMVDIFGTRRIGAGNLVGFSLYMFFNRAYRAHPMPQELEAMKIGERVSLNQRKIAFAIMYATVLGAILTFWLLLDNYYRHGAETGYYGPWALGFGRGIYRQLENWLNYPRDPDLPAMGFMGGGFTVAVLLMMARTRFLWFPLHPLGYAMANSWGMYNLWCTLFVAWLLKWVILKQGGLKSYRKAIPFFLGLALGDFILGNIWSISSVLANTTLYQFWP